MQRFAMEKLMQWKTSSRRKPLILEGARQVGKTWLMKEFGKNAYKNTIYINLDDEKIKNFFEDYTDIEKIITYIEVQAKQKVTTDTLIILDEIQQCPNAITSLKYFYENRPDLHIIVAGSLLGLTTHSGTGFPVGKVNFLTLYPLSFTEFLCALGENILAEQLLDGNVNVINNFSGKLTDLLKYYFFVGGMPEVVQHFSIHKDFKIVREIQNEIITSYKSDFSKHTDANTAQRIEMLWNSISSQLAKENKKFIYNAVKNGSRAKDFDVALTFLKNSGLTYKVTRIKKPYMPINAYEDMDVFKLFLADIGLLGALSKLPAQSIIDGNNIFTEFKGALTEQYVLQELKIIQDEIHYWSSDSNVAKIDFVVQKDNQIMPIETKSAFNVKAKSLRQYRIEYNPEISIRTSLKGFEINNGLYNIPLYAISSFEKLIAN
ncbi:MAG: ATP-binding protein [Alphaproteobacteria bacterium]|nr:ATP-binding protein [Alphaproteobacteria bacterium]